MVEQKTADHRARGKARGTEHGPRADGGGTPVRRVHRGDDRKRGRYHARGSDAHHDAGADQRVDRRAERGEDAREPEDRVTEQEDLPPAEAICHPAAEDEEPGERDRVRVDHPLQLLVDASSSVPMNGNATLVIVMSIAVVNAQRHNTASAIVRRRLSTSIDGSAWLRCNRPS